MTLISSEFPPGPGGIGIHAWQIVRILNKSGMNVKVLCPLDHVNHTTAKRFDISQGFEIVRWPGSKFSIYNNLLRIFLSVKKMWSWEPSCVIGTGSKGVLISWLLSLIFKSNFIAIGHGAEFTIHGGFKKRLMGMAFNHANKVVCVSYYTKRIAEQFGVKPEKIQVIYNGADAEFFMPNLNTESLIRTLGLNKKRIILSVGAVSERKAQDVVIRALPLVLEREPDVFYLIVGLPLKKDEYQRLAANLGVEDKVIFVGSVNTRELPKYYNLCEVFVLNSRIAIDGENEGFGIVLVEAGLCGKPVIGTKGCGIEEVIVDRETGYLVDPDSPEQTADAITKLLENPEEARAIGQLGRERALSMFTWERCGKEFYNLISNLAE